MRAAIRKELLFVPAGFSGDLRKEAAGKITFFNIDAVDTETQRERIGGFFQRREDRDFDIEGG